MTQIKLPPINPGQFTKLHEIDTTALPRGMPHVPVRELIDQQREMMDGISNFYRDETSVMRPEHHPAFERTLRWLEQHCTKDATA